MLKQEIKEEDFNKIAFDKLRAKEITKSVKLTHENYKKCIFGTTEEELKQTCEFNLIKSNDHQIHSIKVEKISACSYETKRYWTDRVNGYAFGHYRTREQ